MRDVGLEGNRLSSHAEEGGSSSSNNKNTTTTNNIVPTPINNDQIFGATATFGDPLPLTAHSYDHTVIPADESEVHDTFALLESFVASADGPDGQPPDPISTWADWLVFRREGKHQEMNPTVAALGKNLPQSQFLALAAQDLPDEAVAMSLLDIYCFRIRFLVGHIVHIPTMRRQITAFYANGRVCDDPTWLALFFALCLVVASHPPREWAGLELWTRTEVARRWYDDSMACLELSQNSSSSLVYRDRNAIRAALLLDFYEPDQLKSFARLRMEITSAQILGLQTDGKASASLLEREMDRRLWWALCVRDWVGAIGYGTHMIQPEHTRTQKPGNYNDEDLELGLEPRAWNEMTEMSFVLSNIELADVIRQDAHLRHKNGLSDNADVLLLDAKYRSILEEMPVFFQVAVSKVDVLDLGLNALVQSWLLRLGVFQKLLGLHRKMLGKRPRSREFCVDLATKILIIQRLIHPHCSILDVMWPNLVLSFSAGIIVALDLIQSSHENQLPDRNFIRELITEALQTLQYVSAVHKDVGSRMETILSVLLKEEDDIWSHGPTLPSGDPSGSLLKERIIARVQLETTSDFQNPFSAHFHQSSTSSTIPSPWRLGGSPFSHPIGVNGVQISSGGSSLLANPSFYGDQSLRASVNDPVLPVSTESENSRNDASDLYAWLLSQGLDIETQVPPQ